MSELRRYALTLMVGSSAPDSGKRARLAAIWGAHAVIAPGFKKHVPVASRSPRLGGAGPGNQISMETAVVVPGAVVVGLAAIQILVGAGNDTHAEPLPQRGAASPTSGSRAVTVTAGRG
jgi:hypothetical protein